MPRCDSFRPETAKGIIRSVLMVLHSICLLFVPAISAKDSIHIKLPVRVLVPEGCPSYQPDKSDFRVMINDKPVRIDSLSNHFSTLSESRNMGRHFFLSFHITKIDSQIESTLAHFLTEVLIEKDDLHLFSPLKIYRIKVSTNKGAMLNSILGILKSDCTRFRNSMVLCEKSIENEILKISRILSDLPLTHYPFYNFDEFEKYYKKKIGEYQNDCLNVHLNQFFKIKELIPDDNAEPWVIHFQDQKIFSFLDKTSQFFKTFGRNGYFRFFSSLVQFNREIMEPEPGVLDSIQHIILDKKIRYGVLLFTEAEKNDNGALVNLEKICRGNSGFFLPVRSAGDAIQNLKDHREQHLEISFSLAGTDQDVTIHITAALPGIELIYRNHYQIQELLKLDTGTIQGKIRITDTLIEKDRMSFTVDSYRMDQSGKFALFKIEIDGFDIHEKQVFHTENILRATEKQTSLIVRIPFYQFGFQKLTVTATDLIANQSSQSKKEITPGKDFPNGIASPDSSKWPVQE
jgi:hypothetical protein